MNVYIYSSISSPTFKDGRLSLPLGRRATHTLYSVSFYSNTILNTKECPNLSQVDLKCQNLLHLDTRRLLRCSEHHGRVHHQTEQRRPVLVPTMQGNNRHVRSS